MGKCFAPNSVRRSHGLEGTERPSDCYFCLANITGITSKYTVKYPDFPSAMRPVPHSEELPVPKPLENLTFSDNNSYSDEVHGQQEGDNGDCDPTFDASCSLSEPHLLTQGDLNYLVRDLNLTKKQAELLGSRLKGWNLLVKYVFFAIAKLNSKNFSLKKTICYL
jgi:hypothetical protein